MSNKEPQPAGRRAVEEGIGTYMVGFFYDLMRLFERLRMGKEHRQRVQPFRSFFRIVKNNWRKRNYWNGYLAEWHYPPKGVILHNCGHGWTRHRALRSLGMNIVKSNLSWQEGIEHGTDDIL